MNILKFIKAYVYKIILLISMPILLLGCSISNNNASMPISKNTIILSQETKSTICNRKVGVQNAKLETYFINTTPLQHISKVLDGFFNDRQNIYDLVTRPRYDENENIENPPIFFTLVSYVSLHYAQEPSGVPGPIWNKYFGSCRPFKGYAIAGDPVALDRRRVYDIGPPEDLLYPIKNLRNLLEKQGFVLGVIKPHVYGHLPILQQTYAAYKDDVLITWIASRDHTYLGDPIHIYIFDPENNNA